MKITYIKNPKNEGFIISDDEGGACFIDKKEVPLLIRDLSDIYFDKEMYK